MRNNSVRPYFNKETYRKAYLTDPHFLRLKNKLIYSNPDAKCWICEKKSTLLLHHISYLHLYREKKVFTLGTLVIGDVVVLCFDCHTKVHFIGSQYFFRIKVPVKKFWLVKRMYYLRFLFVLRNKSLPIVLYYFFMYIMCI